MEKIIKFISRLKNIDINVELIANYPWIYIDKINGIKVIEKFQANHGFTIAFYNKSVEFTDITETFKLIRLYINGK